MHCPDELINKYKRDWNTVCIENKFAPFSARHGALLNKLGCGFIK
jgi:hypothetical protein